MSQCWIPACPEYKLFVHTETFQQYLFIHNFPPKLSNQTGIMMKLVKNFEANIVKANKYLNIDFKTLSRLRDDRMGMRTAMSFSRKVRYQVFKKIFVFPSEHQSAKLPLQILKHHLFDQ